MAAMRGGGAPAVAVSGVALSIGRNALSLAKREGFFTQPGGKPAGYKNSIVSITEYPRRSSTSNINPWVPRQSKRATESDGQSYAAVGHSAGGGFGLDEAVKNAIAFHASRFGAARMIGRIMPSLAPGGHGVRVGDYSVAHGEPSEADGPPDRLETARPAAFLARKNKDGGPADWRLQHPGKDAAAPSADGVAVKQAIEDHFALAARLPPAGMTGFDPRLSPAWAGMQLPG